MNIHELFCSKQKVHELIGHSSTVHEQFMKSIQEHFMNTFSWTVGKIFDERSMNCSWIYMNVHECTIKVHDFMNKFSPGCFQRKYPRPKFGNSVFKENISL
jgi:hypothetical protein